jgi:hypothetical protein
VSLTGLRWLQTGIIVAGLAIPAPGSLLTMADIYLTPNGDASPLTFGLSNLIAAIGLFWFGIFDVIAIARRAVMAYIADPAVAAVFLEILGDNQPQGNRS